MKKVRSLAIAAALLTLVAAEAGSAQVRPGSPRPGSQTERPFRMYVIGGYAQLDVDELNERLTSLDEPYSEVSEDMVVLGLGLHGRAGRFILGGETAVQASIETAESGDERKAELTGFNGSALLGFSILQSDGFDFYPLVQLGWASATLEVSERGDPTWEEVLSDPGRRSTLTTATFYGAGGVGMDYTFRNGFFLGLRGTYAYTPGADSWSEESGDVLGGPEMTLSGPSVRLLVGIGGR